MGFTRSTSAPVLEDAPSMKVRVPARAPTTPPDIGASTNLPCSVQWTALATPLEDVGSIVEQSMKSLSCVDVLGNTGSSRPWKTILTCEGSGRTVMMVSFRVDQPCTLQQRTGQYDSGFEKESEDWL